jgi:hypothetical protein
MRAIQSDYYTSQSRKLLDQLDKFLTQSRALLTERYGKVQAATMHREILDEYGQLIPDLPYIGRGNIFTGNLVQSAWALALYRVIGRHDGSLEEASEIIHRAMEVKVNRIPAFLRRLKGNFRLSRWAVRMMQKAARRSQKREYPGDWVFEVVKGDGETFDVGMDVTECGIVKFLHAQGADELTPHLCNLDYLVYQATGVELRRTMTLSWGCEKCDFRMIGDGEPRETWPPRFVEKHCGDSVE